MPNTPRLITLFALSAATACGAGNAVRPKDFTGAAAAGIVAEACSGLPKPSKPLIVDLDPDARVDLEAAMSKGLVVVNYDCKSIQVVAGCTLPEAGYDYAGVSRKEQVVQLKSQDDVAANLPLSSGKIGGEVHSGRSIDLALVLVGKRSTVVSSLDRGALKGGCEGATHFLQSASVGAFSMATGSAGKAAAVGELFKIGASASSESSRKATSADGSLEACRTSSPNSPAPPLECGAPLRVELRPFAEGAQAASNPGAKRGPKGEGDPEAKPVENPCREGYNFADGICTRAGDVARLCRPKDREDCEAQCEKGSAESCYNFASLLPSKATDVEHAAAYKKACDLGHADGCAWYGFHLTIDEPFNKPIDVAKHKESIAAKVKACDMGSADGCEFAGSNLESEAPPLEDKPGAVRAYERGCSLGSTKSCSDAAIMIIRGEGVAKDPKKGIALLSKSCSAGKLDNCDDLASMLFEGADVPKDLERAYRLSKKACDADKSSCELTADIALGLGKDDEAFTHVVRACDGHNGWVNSCLKLADFYAEGRGTAKAPAKAKEIWKKYCKETEDEDACKHLGVKKAAAKPKAKPAKKAPKGAPAK